MIPYKAKIFGTEFTWNVGDGDDSVSTATIFLDFSFKGGGYLQVTRVAYNSVILLKLVDESPYWTASMPGLVQKWRHLSEDSYNNQKLQFDMVRMLR